MSKILTLGGGCFWCLEACFKRLKGVKTVASGYAGGKTTNPTYEEVCSGSTGHAEVVQVGYDASELPTKELVNAFFHMHDPTTLNAQGADVGTQYRSIVLYSDDDQVGDIRQVYELLNQKKFGGKIVTQVAKLEKFYPAEEYHRNYFENNPDKAYCRNVVLKKVKKFEEYLLSSKM